MERIRMNWPEKSQEMTTALLHLRHHLGELDPHQAVLEIALMVRNVATRHKLPEHVLVCELSNFLTVLRTGLGPVA